MDDKTLEYMEERVKTGQALKRAIAGLEGAREALKRPEAKYLHIGIGDHVGRYDLSRKDVPTALLHELVADDLDKAFEKAIDRLKEEYAKL